MAVTSAMPAGAAASPPPAAGTQRAGAAGAADFAGLIGLAVSATTMPAEIADTEGLGDAEAPADADETDAAADAAPPLLSWLFGLMASTGASLPGAQSPAKAANADAQAPPPTAADLPATIGTAGVAAATLSPMAAGAPLARGAGAALPLGTQADLALAAAAFANLAEGTIDPGATRQVPGAAARATTGGADAADAAAMAADIMKIVPPELPAADAGAAPPADAPFADLLASMPEAGAADLLRDMTQARPAQAGDAALLLSAATASVPRASTPVAAAAAAFVAGGALNALSEGFVADLGEHIEWQLGDGISEARIELHPAELGALTVRIETQGDQARVHIVAAEAATRSLLNQAMPQLRELLAGSGMNLARSQVDSGERRDGRSGERGNHPPSAAGVRRRITQVLLVDAYA